VAVTGINGDQTAAAAHTSGPVVSKKVGALRRQGKLPAILYGHRIETTPILLDAFEGPQTLSH
jgi:ribosomal protein L25 (general stress protein Ctc)